MPVHWTLADALVLAGMAINTVSFWLMFRRLD